MVSYSKRAIWLTAAFYALDTLFLMFDLESSAGRELTLGLFASTLAGLAWWERRVRRRGERRKVVIIRCAIATLALIFVANALGFVLLSSLLRSWTLLGSFIALVMYTLGRTLFVFAGAFLRLPRIRSFAAVRLYERDVLKWTRRALNALMAICWTIVVLDVMAMRTDAMKALSSAVDTKAGNALGFVCVLVIGYLASKAVRFVLREDILPSMRLPRGVPETIFNGVYYISLVLFFLISLSVAGFQLDKLTVMTGALGVGVGLGLQSFVNNFVSGIVLQFERPIRIGDVLEIGTLGGEVSRIGIRSSTVRTFQGAEVVIPNSTLISNQVVNWTLTEPLRRVDLQVPIAYGTPPEQVIGILSTVAASHPEVLRNPPPGAFFQGFGASSLDFVLQFWAEQSNHFRLRSEIAIAVNAALREARIVIPFPQQDIHVRSIDAAVRENLDPAEGPRHHAVAR